MRANIKFHIISPSDKNPEEIQVYYDLIETQFGYSLFGIQDNKICHISFQDDDLLNLDKLKANWPNASLIHDPRGIKEIAKKVFDGAVGKIDVLLKGTNLQVSVWKELTKIIPGTTVSYERMAELVGKPRAIRPVARAVATNKIAYLIPCHRVIKKNGDIHKYGSGPERKKKMLSYENAI
ncbi:methylated-dna--protein-cysteine methyltransferase [Holotrichia oblita]|uniref:Methylated-dna--protein-cysteine methyltransferase n=1 Tax=Holotrichia oblita TaxID=644536 RepID=A0ACB9SI42_HOLOL|nr:methylated-dna--protein-cysteine methyltransferase [Holotrichia oblita]